MPLDATTIVFTHFVVGTLVWLFFIWYNKKNKTLSLARFQYSVFIPMFGFISLLVALVMGMGALLTKIYTVFKLGE